MVEDGGQLHTASLSQGVANEIHLAIASLVVGGPSPPAS
ncbi:hypothetical protein [Streptomyces sp. NPDC046887]